MARSSVPVQTLLAFISSQDVTVKIGKEERRLTPQDLMDPKCFRAATEAYEKAQKADGGEDKEKKRKKNTAHMLLVSSGSVVQIRSVQNTILEKAGAEGALQTYALLNSLPEEATEIVTVVETDDSFTIPKEGGDLETFLSRLGLQVSV